jgi:hypothetical protein
MTERANEGLLAEWTELTGSSDPRGIRDTKLALARLVVKMILRCASGTPRKQTQG